MEMMDAAAAEQNGATRDSSEWPLRSALCSRSLTIIDPKRNPVGGAASWAHLEAVIMMRAWCSWTCAAGRRSV